MTLSTHVLSRYSVARVEHKCKGCGSSNYTLDTSAITCHIVTPGGQQYTLTLGQLRARALAEHGDKEKIPHAELHVRDVTFPVVACGECMLKEWGLIRETRIPFDPSQIRGPIESPNAEPPHKGKARAKSRSIHPRREKPTLEGLLKWQE